MAGACLAADCKGFMVRGVESADLDLSSWAVRQSVLVARSPRIDGLGTEKSLSSVAGMLEAAATSTAFADESGVHQQAKGPAELATAGSVMGRSVKQRLMSATSINRSRDGRRPSTGPLNGSSVRRAARNHAPASRGVAGGHVVLSLAEAGAAGGRMSATSAPLRPACCGGGHQLELPQDGATCSRIGLGAGAIGALAGLGAQDDMGLRKRASEVLLPGPARGVAAATSPKSQRLLPPAPGLERLEPERQVPGMRSPGSRRSHSSPAGAPSSAPPPSRHSVVLLLEDAADAASSTRQGVESQ